MLAILRMTGEDPPVHLLASATPEVSFSLMALGLPVQRGEELVKALLKALEGKYTLVETKDDKQTLISGT